MLVDRSSVKPIQQHAAGCGGTLSAVFDARPWRTRHHSVRRFSCLGVLRAAKGDLSQLRGKGWPTGFR
jgi:hypothetical protein